LTQRDIARLAGVSTATVSRVINKQGNVSPDTERKVLSVIEKYGYLPNTIAKSLRIRRTRTIGFIVPDIGNPFFPEVLKGIEAVCVERGYNLILGNTNEDIKTEMEVVRNLRQQSVDGLLMILVDSSGGTLKSGLRGTDRALPVVFIDRHIQGFRHDSVIIDNEGGVYQATRYLIGLGHKRIAIIHGPSCTTPGDGRRRGYMRAMREGGIDIVSQYMKEGDFRIASGYQLTRELLLSPKPPTAIIGGNNLMTIGSFKAIRDIRIDIPNQVSLVGFDDFLLSAYLTPPITVIDRPMSDMGKIAAELLISRIENDDKSAVREIVLPTELKIRQSCVAPN